MNYPKSDIAFVGAGIATSFALLNLADTLSANSGCQTIRIALIDKYPEFFSGIPYGKRSGETVLLINSLYSFLPDVDERNMFIDWLKRNKNQLVRKFVSTGGVKARKWLDDNKKYINEDIWDDLFIPRSFFGVYIAEKVKSSLARAESRNIIKVDYIVSEVTDVEKNDKGAKILMKNGGFLQAQKIVISVGSLPAKKIKVSSKLAERDNFLLINSIYDTEFDANIKRMRTFLSNRKGKNTNVLIIGANASSLETVYKITDIKEIRSAFNKLFVLSTQGVMPDSEVDKDKLVNYKTTFLNALANKKELTAKEIADATFKDLEVAESMNLGAASTVEIISSGFGALLHKLSPNELSEFACLYGNEIGKRQRCAGQHYIDSVNDLKREHKLEHIAGRYLDLLVDKNDACVLEYLDTKTQQHKILDKNIHLVINCMGSTNFDNEDVPILLNKMITKSYGIPNESKIGFAVNERFEASKDVYIAGPLLAGNVMQGNALWHLEHCGRIIWTSKLLSTILADDFCSR